MAKAVSACALFGFLFVQLSIGCSPSTGVAPSMGYGGQGTGSTPSTSVAGSGNSISSGTGGNAYVVNTKPMGTDVLSKLVASCGNSKRDNPDEQCDDGNTTGGDGCSKTCQLENPNEWTCPETGACTSSAICGNGTLNSNEVCDDGNTTPNDGCSADCQSIDDGWQCRMPGKPCIPKCGDGQIKGDEQCDDSNKDNGDGCSATCILEPGFDCSGGTCKEIKCGDSVQTGPESCDVGKENGLFYGDGSGCSKTCTKEPVCARGTTAGCEEVCGNGNKGPGEACDDGNNNDGDGCSADCSTVEEGFNCEDKPLSDAEDCPSKPGTQCLVLPVVYRDFEGQNVTGGHPDFFYMGAAVSGGRTVGVTTGASKTTCMPNAIGTQLTFTAGGVCPNNDQSGPCTGLVASALDTNGKPVMAKQKCHCIFTDWDNTGILGTCSGASCTSAGLTGTQTCYVDGSGDNHLRIEGDVNVFQSADSFKQWYTDSDFSNRVVGSLELAKSGNLYQFSSSRPGDPAGSASRTRYDDLHDACLANPHSSTLSTGFFPLEDQTGTKICNITSYWMSAVASASDANCCAGTGCPVKAQFDPLASWDNCPTAGTGGMVPKSDGTGGKITGKKRNFYFTTEVRYLFRYDGTNATLSFNGDDDVWAYINGILALDLGGTHERAAKDVVINASTYKLTSGNTYEIAVFQAERGPVESNYQLTLSGFSTVRTQCGPTCGDGKTTAGEECDLGKAQNNGSYNGCTDQCTWGPFCGDGNVDSPDEDCDNGSKNGDVYGKSGCTGNCKTPAYCGDGKIDGAQGEECDTVNLPTSTCTDKCTLILGPIN
jgi:fibro-slime domain-containing protein